ncbi:MAG: carbon-nitrogen hydrolase family protein [Pseudomonadales bacterium]
MKLSHTQFKAAVLQMVSGNDVRQNLDTAATLIARAASAGAVLIVLPENFALFATRKLYALGEREMSAAGDVQQFIAGQAKKYRVYIVAGSLPIADLQQHKVYATSLLFGPDGQQLARYDKIHLFDADVDDAQGRYCESDYMLAGSEVVSVETEYGRLGLAICYDLRFPELFRAMFEQGVDIIALPSAFTEHTGAAHWEPLLRARAIENCCYVLAANQGGEHNGKRRTWGHSMIVDPWGTVLVESGSGEDCQVTSLDLAKQQQLRGQLPVHTHQRIAVTPIRLG